MTDDEFVRAVADGDPEAIAEANDLAELVRRVREGEDPQAVAQEMLDAE